MRGTPNEILQETRCFWQDRTGQPVSEEDARRMVGSVVAFFQVLSDWEEHATEITDSNAPSSPGGPDRGQTRTTSRTCPD